MGTISRGTKSGTGTTDFGTGTTILAAEVNTDLNTITNVINGNLDANNLANNAVTTVKITDLNVTTAKLAADAVTTAKITDLNVTTGKLAVGAAQYARVEATPSISLNITTGETTVVTLPSLTTRGGPVEIFGSVAWYCSIDSGGGGLQDLANVTIRLKRDGSTRMTWHFSTIPSASVGAALQLPLPPVIYGETPAAGAYVYSITAQTNGSVIHVRTAAVSTGYVFARELA